MKHVTWWKGAATHIWRVYFRFQRDGLKPDTVSKKKSFLLCDEIIRDLSETERDFLSGYFTSQWGHDAEFVETYSKESGIGTVRLWRLVEDANREFFERVGLLEPQKKTK